MEYLIVGLVSFIASFFTLFTGFGLGTILLPVFTIFFSVDIAIAMTAVVHLSNNLFKLLLLGKHADKKIILQFGIPAILAAVLGSLLLLWLSWIPAITSYTLFGKTATVSIIKFVIAVLMILFALFEIVPCFSSLTFEKKHLVVGGFFSGFFGGLSGHQGMLRSAFLAKAGLTREVFIGTGVTIACLVDISRLAVYGNFLAAGSFADNYMLVITAIASAFLGALLGNRILQKITLRAIQILVGILLILISFGLGAGVI